MGNGRIAESTVHGEWSLKHHYIQLHYGFADKSPDYEALVFIGFVEPEKTYACHWLDVYGAGFDARSPRPAVLTRVSVRKVAQIHFGR